MSTVNGELEPPASESPGAISSPGKRKRVASHDDTIHHGHGDEERHNSASPDTSKKSQVDQTMRDLLQVMASHDTELSVLKFPLPNHSSERSNKRTKLASNAGDGTNTIEQRVLSGHYNTLQELVSDVEIATKSIIEQYQSNSPAKVNSSGLSMSIPDLVNHVAAFKKHLNSFVMRSSFQTTAPIKAEPREEQEKSDNLNDIPNTLPREDKTVLTVFANCHPARQLFSSIKQPATDGSHVEGTSAQDASPEVSLPNGITTTKVVPYNPAISEEKPKVKTFGEVFAPRSTLPQLEPPRRSTNRSSSITFVDPVEAENKAYLAAVRGDRTKLYHATGSWLKYGSRLSSSQRQSQYNRPDDSRRGAVEQDLFLGAYSSFAPSFDSSGATVSREMKNRMWWMKYGRQRVDAFLSLAYPEPELEGDTGLQLENLDESTLEEDVKTWVPLTLEDMQKMTGETESGDSDKDTETVLDEISNLLETLSFFRRNRLSAPPHQGVQGQEELSGPSLSPDKPTAEEISTYEALKAGLAAMISTLPPHAVAKLDGHRLGDLNISKKILVENPDYPGVMEEDEFTAKQKQAGRLTPGIHANRTATPTLAAGSRSTFQTPTGAAAVPQRPLPPSAIRAPPTPGGLPQQYYGARQYSTGNVPQQNQTPRQPQRAAYASTPYSQPGMAQRPAQNGLGPYTGQQGQPIGQASPQSFAQRPAQPSFQPRVQDNAYRTAFNATRSASPQRQPSYATPQARRSYVNSPTSQQRPAPQPTPNPASSTPANPYANRPAAMNYTRSAAEQAALMDRNKAQLAAAQQRQASGTPQPPTGSSNGQYAAAQGGNATPTPTQQNGVSVASGGNS